MNDLVSRDRRVLWHPYTQHGRGIAPLAVTKAEGAWLELSDGRRVLDGISSWWTSLHGHRVPEIMEAIARQTERIDHIQLGSCTHEAAVELGERLVAVTPGPLTRVFYSDDGSTAVESALKMALGYHRRCGEQQRTRLLALEDAYHGDTAGAMSVSAPSPFTADFTALMTEVSRIPLPGPERTEEECIAALTRILDREGASCAALIVEPLLMGAAGMKVTTAGFLRSLREVTAAHGVLLIADEVFTGFGRTGALFACEQAGVEPDLMCLSKALTGGILPLAATLATEEIFQAFVSPSVADAFLHGHSFTGNPIACAAALASLDLLDEARLARAREIGDRLERRLAPLGVDPHVKELRGVGLVRALELQDIDGSGYLSDVGPRMTAAALSLDVLLRPLGNVLYAVPPLCVADDEVDLVADAMASAVQVIRSSTS